MSTKLVWIVAGGIVYTKKGKTKNSHNNEKIDEKFYNIYNDHTTSNSKSREIIDDIKDEVVGNAKINKIRSKKKFEMNENKIKEKNQNNWKYDC